MIAIQGPMIHPIITEIDNAAALKTENSNKISARNRHFLVREEIIREAVQDKIIKLQYTPTDGLTKALQRMKRKTFCNKII